jgi:hypothetical protein
VSLIKKYSNSNTWNKGNILFIISLIVLSLGILFLIIGYDIYPLSAKNIISPDDAGLITVPKVGHINLIEASNQYFIF